MDAGRGDFMAKFFGEIMPMVEAARPVAKVSARLANQRAYSKGTTAEKQKPKDGILTALSQIKATGSFASFKSVFDPLERRLVVKNVGPIKFPITKLQTRQLIKRARQAPYDKGNKTLVDTSVCKTWELDFAFGRHRHRKERDHFGPLTRPVESMA